MTTPPGPSPFDGVPSGDRPLPPPPPPPGYSVPPAPPGPPTGSPPGYDAVPPGYSAFTPANAATAHGRLATFGQRFGAWLLDGLLYGLVGLATAIPGVILIIASFEDCTRLNTAGSGTSLRCVGDQLQVGTLLGGIGLIAIGFLAVAALYIRALATTGQTWGRKIVGIKVINEQTGAAPGWGKAVGRSIFAWIVSGQIFYIGYLWMLWDDRKQTLHDKVAGTHVIEA